MRRSSSLASSSLAAWLPLSALARKWSYSAWAAWLGITGRLRGVRLAAKSAGGADGATFSTGDQPAGWRKSSHSSVNANCVEINLGQPDRVRIRDSKDGSRGPTITVTPRQWAAVIDQIASTTP